MNLITSDRIRNVAIVGHGGSGKTMLVEHMLFTAGATDRLGSTDQGTTQSDFDALEAKRHSSLSAAITPLIWQDIKVNLIDVPGFPDFIGDLHAVARVVESMIIVCEAKRDLDVGFELAFKVAQEHGLATCIFVNKLERDNADYQGLIETLHRLYGKRIVNTQIPIGDRALFSGVLDCLNMKVYKGRDRGVEIEEIPSSYALEAIERQEKMMDAAAEGDDALAEKYLDGATLTADEIDRGLMIGIETGRVIPILLGSAATGIGVAPLLDRIIHELPSPVEFDRRPASTRSDSTEVRPVTDVTGPLRALCFKTTADPFVGRLNYVRVFSGQLHTDDMIWNSRTEREEKLHHLAYPHGKNHEFTKAVVAGDICVVAKAVDVRTGDSLSTKQNPMALPAIQFPTPIFRVALHPQTKSDEDKIGMALEKLLEEDPTLHYMRDPSTHQEILEGMGDMHLDTVVERLKTRYGVNVVIDEARVPYKETVRGKSKAQGRHKRQTGGKGQFGDCWIELEPLAPGEGFAFESRIVGGAIPKNFVPAIEKGIREAMEHGFIAGYPAVDIKVTVVDGSYHEVDSNEQAFKMAGALAIREAISKAQPVLLEPLVHLEVEVPDEHVGDVVGDLNGRRGRLQGMEQIAPGKTGIKAIVPQAAVSRYALDLRAMTKGRGYFRQEPSHYEETPMEEAQKLIKKYNETKALAEVH